MPVGRSRRLSQSACLDAALLGSLELQVSRYLGTSRRTPGVVPPIRECVRGFPLEFPLFCEGAPKEDRLPSPEQGGGAPNWRDGIRAFVRGDASLRRAHRWSARVADARSSRRRRVARGGALASRSPTPCASEVQPAAVQDVVLVGSLEVGLGTDDLVEQLAGRRGLSRCAGAEKSRGRVREGERVRRVQLEHQGPDDHLFVDGDRGGDRRRGMLSGALPH
jgi:hypothetical protein